MKRNIFIGGKMECQSLIYESALQLPHDDVITFRRPADWLPGIRYTNDTENHSKDSILCVGLEFGYMPRTRGWYEGALNRMEEITYTQQREAMNMLIYLSKYKKIVHFIVDPLEMPLSTYFDNATCVSDYAYTNRHGIKVKAHDMYSRYLMSIAPEQPTKKTWRLYFGANEFYSGSRDRKQWLEFVHDAKGRLEESMSRINIYINSKDDKSNQVSQAEYMANLARSKYTLVGPANAPGHFSSLRVREALSVGCIPLVWRKSNWEVMDYDGPDFKTFDTIEELKILLKS